MIKVLQLIFAPLPAWTKIAAAKRGVVTIFVLYALPLMLLGSLGEGYGMVKFGLLRGEFERSKPVPIRLEVAQRFEGVQLVADLLILFLGAKFIQWVANGFHVPTRFTTAFTVLAYSLGPLFLARALDGVPAINTWICWTIGVILALHVLYNGVGPIFQPDQTKGFGLFLVCALVVLFFSGLAHFIALAVLSGKLLV